MKRTEISEIFPEATKEQIDKLLDINGADINTAKGSMNDLQTQLAAAQAEIQGLKDKDQSGELAAVTKELNDLKAANALRDLRAKVSKDTGVPADLLTGETEEACKSQAEAIKAYSDSRPNGGYPRVKDAGEAGAKGAAGKATRDIFAEFMQEKLPAT